MDLLFGAFYALLCALVLFFAYRWFQHNFRLETFLASSSSDNNNNNNNKNTDDKFYWSKPDTRQLTCIVSGPDGGQRYCVRDTKNKQAASELLGTVVRRCSAFVERLALDHPHHPVAIRLHERFEPERMMESLPDSEYTAHTENKGEKIALCLTPKKDDASSSALIDDHTLTFVALHELAHVGTVSTENHGPDFWHNFTFLLQCAQDQGIHDSVDYRVHPVTYCALQINDNPLITSLHKQKPR